MIAVNARVKVTCLFGHLPGVVATRGRESQTVPVPAVDLRVDPGEV
jgi:hypothetical protein